MDGKLLVRVFNVGLGDCIYLRVPDLQRNVHILIDCGNKFGSLSRLGQCITSLKGELPESNGGKKRLDLLVVSHPHEDHQKGFEAEFFDGIQIDHIWLSPVFNRENPQAKGFFALKDAAGRALKVYEDQPAAALAELRLEIQELLSLSKSEALEMLNLTLPARNGIQPLYVSADTPADRLKLFDDPAANLKVLSPMADIDGFYMGGNGLMTTAGEPSSSALVDGYQAVYNDPAAAQAVIPSNISIQDFKALRSSIHADALAAAAVAGHVENNLSVVLLLEWHGRRLLFSGDAEWNAARKGAVTPGSSNGSWNVMWQQRQAELSLPLDFYKVGHHGSENATPWKPPDPQTGEQHPINQILDKLLPVTEAGGSPRTYAVVSTLRTKRWPSIPDAALLEELGKRVANARTAYIEKKGPSSVKPQIPQPARTDLEQQLTQTPNKAVDHIDVEFTPL